MKFHRSVSVPDTSLLIVSYLFIQNKVEVLRVIAKSIPFFEKKNWRKVTIWVSFVPVRANVVYYVLVDGKKRVVGTCSSAKRCDTEKKLDFVRSASVSVVGKSSLSWHTQSRRKKRGTRFFACESITNYTKIIKRRWIFQQLVRRISVLESSVIIAIPPSTKHFIQIFDASLNDKTKLIHALMKI